MEKKRFTYDITLSNYYLFVNVFHSLKLPIMSIFTPKLLKNVNIHFNDKNTLHKIINFLKKLFKKSKITKNYTKKLIPHDFRNNTSKGNIVNFVDSEE